MARQRLTITCPRCNGNGHNEGHDCTLCEQHGRVTVEVVGIPGRTEKNGDLGQPWKGNQ